MSEAGLPGMGLKLGAELLRSPNGVWYSAKGADGATLGVLRFEAAALKPAGAVERLIERVVAARAGMLPGTLPVVDLVEDAGRIWLITSQVPVAESAGRTEALLLGSSPVQPVANAGMANAGVANGYGAHGYPPPGHGTQGSAMETPMWRPSVDLGATGVGQAPPPAQAPEWTKKQLRDPVASRIVRGLVGITLVAAVVGAAAVVGMKMRDKKPTTPVQISSFSVHNTGQVQPSGICDTTVDMVADLTTNGGTGTVRYQWEIPAGNNKTQTIAGTEAVSGKSPKVHLSWRLKLSGSGTVTAKFSILNPEVLAQGALASSSGDLKYQCP